ncbi:hypothetical protein PG990_011791 [Apiospora arundinis]
MGGGWLGGIRKGGAQADDELSIGGAVVAAAAAAAAAFLSGFGLRTEVIPDVAKKPGRAKLWYWAGAAALRRTGNLAPHHSDLEYGVPRARQN